MSKPFKLLLCLGAVLLSTVALMSCTGECPHLRKQTETVEPDCSHEGYTLNTCPDCGYTYKSDFVAPEGHRIVSETVLANCTEAGYTDYRCTADASCDYQYRAVTDEPLGHDYKTYEVIDPTCDKAGYTVYRCARCNDTYNGDFHAPIGHSFTQEHINPTTCAQTGHSTYTCRICHYSYVGDFTFYSDIFEGAYSASEQPLFCGLDVSKYQHAKDEDGAYLPLDFEDIREAGFDFVILKAGSTPRIGTDGQALGGIEPTFEADYAAAREAGLAIGAYFYTYSLTAQDTAKDAALLLEWLEGKQFDYPIYFDLEHPEIADMSRRDITDLCLSFISTLQEKRYFGALYTNNSWLMNHLQTDKVTFLFDNWYARYPDADPYVWGVDAPRHVWNAEKYGEQVGMWQYTQTGRIPAISDTTAFDFDFAYKDYPAIIKALGYNGY